MHTHRFIHLGFYNTLMESDIRAAWIDNRDKANDVVSDGDIVFAVGICCDRLQFRKNVHYVLHNVDLDENKMNGLGTFLTLQVYVRGCAGHGETIGDPTTIYDNSDRVLYQAWGTDVPPYRFAPPTLGALRKRVYWVGSIWNNELNQGNTDAIARLKKSLRQNEIEFVQRHPVSAKTAISLIRSSLFAPALAGEWQVENGYLPCRLFKNVSYGRLGISNVGEFGKIYGSSFIHAASPEDVLDRYLSMNEKTILEMTREQQEHTRRHTYFTKLHNIFSLM